VALVDMKRLTVLAMKRDQARLLQFLQRAGCVHIIPQAVEEAPSDSQLIKDRQQAEELQTRLRWAIGRLAKYDTEKQSMLKPLPLAPREALEQEDLGEALSVVSQVEELMRKTGELRGSETRYTQQAEQLEPWLGLDMPANKLRATATTRVFAGNASARKLAEVQQAWQGRPAIISLLSQKGDTATFYAVVHQSAAEEFVAALRQIAYQPAMPHISDLSPREQLDQINQHMDALKAEAAAIEKELSQLGVHLPRLRLAYEAVTARKERLSAMDLMAHTRSTVLLSGWVPGPSAPALLEALKKEFPEVQAVASDPGPEDDPPVLLHNNAVVRPYEAVVSGFALPKNGTMDPTSVMMPFFACFFGMMVSDAGYGIMMALLIPILVKLLKPSEGAKRIFWIICGGGVFTVFWGAMYNTWFGFSPWPSVFDPVNNSLPVMGLCIGLGALHLFAGLMVGAAQNFRNKDPMSAIYDQFSWMFLIIGLGLLMLPQTAEIGKWMAIVSAGIILVTAGRSKSKNPIKRLISGLGALYGITGWISDLLSYMRLFGMGLATGVIGMVINQLVGMLTGGGIIGLLIGAVVFVGAHLFNAAINILGAYVHSARLQYIEFFGKFYEEGGKPFKPLRFAPRYVRIHE